MCIDGVRREVNSGVEVSEEIKQQEDNAQTTFFMRSLTSVPDRNALSVGQVNWDGPSVDCGWKWWFSVCAFSSLGKSIRNRLHRWMRISFFDMQSIKWEFYCLLSSLYRCIGEYPICLTMLHAKPSTMPAYSTQKHIQGRFVFIYKSQLLFLSERSN